MKQFISDYLNFSKKERRGHIVLLVITVLVFLAPLLLPLLVKRPARPAGDELSRQLAALTIEKDTATGSNRSYGNGNRNRNYAAYNKNRSSFRRYWESDT